MKSERQSAVSFGARLGAMVLLALLLLGGACKSALGPAFTTWEGELVPEPSTHLAGRVAAVTQFGRTQVSIQLQEAEPGQVYGWRIDSGSCSQPGLIQGGTAAYPFLVPGELGTAGTEAVLAVAFRDGDHYAARVYRSDGGTGEEVLACGELEQTR